jgi:UDP-MurNAc hydroxylase
LKEYSILNINDCVIHNKVAAENVILNFKKYTNKIDLLLTQFGYANWLGNKNEKQRRVSSASEKLNRVKLQIENFNPRFVIPFASFVYFCHPENFHTNDSQNQPADVDNLFKQNNFKSDLIIVKSMDNLDLSLDLAVQNQNVKNFNIEYWRKLQNQIKIDILEEIKFSKDEIILEYKNFKKKIFKSFLILPFILEKLKFLSPIKLYLHDLDLNINLSYTNKLKIETGKKSDANIALSSATLMFILKNEYGSNTTSVNGKFERISANGVQKFYRHFSPQEYMKMGYGLNHPITSLIILFGKLIHKLSNKKWVINPSLDN